MKQKILSFTIADLFILFFIQSFSQNVGMCTSTPVTNSLCNLLHAINTRIVIST